MTVLRVFDTVLEARKEAEYTYWLCQAKGYNVKYHAIHPYIIHDGDDIDIYVVNKVEYVRGMRVNKIEDYTRNGVCDEIRACEYSL